MENTKTDLDQTILTILKNCNKPVTAKEIWQKLNKTYTKKDINRALYHSLTKQNVWSITDNHSAPLWSLMGEGETTNNVNSKKETDDYGCTVTVVFIDLGNVHDCLEFCEKYTMLKKIDYTYAFADYHFNGYGINPKVNTDNVKVLQANNTHKNSGDILLVWTCSKLILKNLCGKEKIHFIVVTKDDGFRYLSDLVCEEGHIMHFVNSKQLLKEYIE